MIAGRSHILLIDDDPDMHMAVELILAADHYELVCYRTGVAGWEAMRRQRPDLVLLDIMLAEPTEGLQIACKMRQDEHLKGIPIILISAMGEAPGAAYAREVCPVDLAADIFLEKPFSPATLREAVRQVLARRTSSC
jgi:DNA-binding response OmpR family regulator